MAKQAKPRAKFKCPPELREAIDAANLFPPEIPASQFGDSGAFVLRRFMEKKRRDDPTYKFKKIGEEGWEKHHHEWTEYRRAALTRRIDDILSVFPDVPTPQARYPLRSRPEIEAIAFEHAREELPNGTTDTLLAAAVRWLEGRGRDRNEFAKVASFGEIRREVGIYDDPGLRYVFSPDSNPTSAAFEGTIAHILRAPLAGILDRVDWDRIRVCLRCRKIFWAPRCDSVTCSDGCRNAIHTRRHKAKKRAAGETAEEREARNAKRRANRRYKKTLSQGSKSDATIETAEL